MAKIQIDGLKELGQRYGALEANTGVPTVNLQEGVSLVHDVSRDLTAAQGRYIAITTTHAHAAAGTIGSSVDPGAALNILGEGASTADRWVRGGEEDLWVIGADGFRSASGGLVFAEAGIGWDPGTGGLALSPGTAVPRVFFVGRWNTIANPVFGGGAPMTYSTFNATIPRPFPIGNETTGFFAYTTITTGAGTMSLVLRVRCWIGPRGTVPPFA